MNQKHCRQGSWNPVELGKSSGSDSVQTLSLAIGLVDTLKLSKYIKVHNNSHNQIILVNNILVKTEVGLRTNPGAMYSNLAPSSPLLPFCKTATVQGSSEPFSATLPHKAPPVEIKAK